jgi:hypothetical protein
MAIQIQALHHPVPSRRVLFAGVGALALASFVAVSQIGAPDYAQLAANQEVEMHTARLPVQNLAELTKQSDAVVVGRVVASGKVHFMQAESQQPHALQPDPRLDGIGKSKEAANAAAAPSRIQTGILTPPSGIPVTDFTVEVSQVLNGKLTKGSQITISQPGGVIELPNPAGSKAPTLVRTLVAEHDPLMVVGQEHVLFVQQSGDGTFHVAGGPDGRFKLDAKRALQPVDEGSPVGQTHKGESVDVLQAKINNVKAGRASD